MQIEKNVVIPKRKGPEPRSENKEIYDAIAQMTVGDSLVLNAHKAIIAQSAMRRRYGNGSAKIRAVEDLKADLIRIWRVK